jgi:uncharacterized membrane protein
MERYDNREPNRRGLALGLGWFSLGLGVAEMTAPRSVARLIGAREDDVTTSVLQAYGARKIATGIAILTQPDNPTWLWARVAGDAVDLSSLTAELNAGSSDRRRLGAALAAVAGVTALDVLCARRLSDESGSRPAMQRRARRDVDVQRVITINKPIEEVYAFWKNFENLPRFMRHLEGVRITGPGRSHWRAKGPARMTVEWDAEVTEDRENERIAWRSLPASDVVHSGSVTFRPAPGVRGTEVRVRLRYEPPAGAIGRTIAWLFGEEPDQQIHEDLTRFKQLMETGEVPVSEGIGLRRAAQPPARATEIRTIAGVTQ